MQELESSLQEQAPQSQGDGAHLHELPPLVIDGIPTPIDKMTQVRLTKHFLLFSLLLLAFISFCLFLLHLQFQVSFDD